MPSAWSEHPSRQALLPALLRMYHYPSCKWMGPLAQTAAAGADLAAADVACCTGVYATRPSFFSINQSAPRFVKAKDEATPPASPPASTIPSAPHLHCCLSLLISHAHTRSAIKLLSWAIKGAADLVVVQLQAHAIMNFVVSKRDVVFVHCVPLLYPNFLWSCACARGGDGLGSTGSGLINWTGSEASTNHAL